MVETSQKIRMPVEMRILKACVFTDQPQEIYVAWKRGTQAVKSDKKMVEQGKSAIDFERKQGCFKIEAGFKKGADGSWHEDSNQLVLYCAGQEVGKYSFNLSTYIGKNPSVQKADIVAANAPSSSKP